MERRERVGRWFARAAVAAGALALAAGAALAGTTGKLSGRVTNQKKEPLAGVNVIVVGQPLGGATDDAGRFTIINIPAGTIAVKAALIGHAPVTVQKVEINADNTTRLDIELRETAVQMEEVVVSARRAVIEVNRTSNIATVSREKLAALPVQELQDVVNLQAGVVDGHFRGGRTGELATTLAASGVRLADLAAKFPTAALATLELERPWAELGPGCARLVDFVKPKELARAR